MVNPVPAKQGKTCKEGKLSRIIGLLFGSIFAFVPVPLFLCSIWFLLSEKLTFPDSVVNVLTVMICGAFALLLTPIGIIILKGVIKNEPEND